MALINHFFWESLSKEKQEPSHNLLRAVEDSFTDVETLRSEMLESADAMFGNGFVWLLRQDNGLLRVMNTYNAGSAFPKAWPRRQSWDTTTRDSQDNIAMRVAAGRLTAGSFGDSSANRVGEFEGQLRAEPILCVNVWQHMYLPDYGILGKRAYLSAWWERIDWDFVFRDRWVRIDSAGPARRGLGRFA